MRLILKYIISLLLLINGIGAIYGGVNFILHPDGSSIQMPLSWLKHSPFTNYLIPGIILLLFNGIFSFVALVALLFNYKHSAWLIIAQGLILTGWIVIQIGLLQTIYFLHIAMGGIGLFLIVLGYVKKVYITP